jgi:hypothetical protein
MEPGDDGILSKLPKSDPRKVAIAIVVKAVAVTGVPGFCGS